MRAGPGRKVKDLEMPITCTLFANSAADWNMQLAATRKSGEKKMFGADMAYRAKHRLQPCEPKPRPAEARRHSPRWLRHEDISNTSVKTGRLLTKNAEQQKNNFP